MNYKERTPVKCSCSLRSLIGFDISEAQAMKLVGVPITNEKNNWNKVIGKIDSICYEKDIVYMTLYSYWLPEINIDKLEKFQSFASVSFEINRFEVEEKFPTFFEETIWHDKDYHPEVYRDIIVRDADGKEYDDHYWVGHAYYNYIKNIDDGTVDGWYSDVDIVKWRYK